MQWDLLLVQEAQLAPASHLYAELGRAKVQARPGQLGPDGCARVVASANLPLDAPDASRVQHFIWYPGGRSSWRIFNCYGRVEATVAARNETSAMVRACAAEADARRKTPALIAGDLNAGPEELGCSFVLGIQGWSDLGGATPTTMASLHPRRIAWLMANPAMQRHRIRAGARWDSGVPTHSCNGQI